MLKICLSAWRAEESVAGPPCYAAGKTQGHSWSKRCLEVISGTVPCRKKPSSQPHYQVAQGTGQLLGHRDFPAHSDPAFLFPQQHIQRSMFHKLLHHDICKRRRYFPQPSPWHGTGANWPGWQRPRERHQHKTRPAAAKGWGRAACLLSEPRTQTPCTKAKWTCDTWLIRLAVSKNACGERRVS